MIRDPLATATIVSWAVMSSSLPLMYTMCTLRLTDQCLMVNVDTLVVSLPILYKISTIILVNVSSQYLLQHCRNRQALARESFTARSIDLHLRRSRLILKRLQKLSTSIPSQTTTIKSSVNSSSSSNLMPAKASVIQSRNLRKLCSNNSLLRKRAMSLIKRLLAPTMQFRVKSR